MFRFNFFKNLVKSPYFIFFEIVLIGALVSISSTGMQYVLKSDAGGYYELASQMVLQRLSLINIFSLKSFMDIGYPFILSILMRVFGNKIIIFQSFNYLCWFLSVIFVYKALNIVTTKKNAFWGSFIMAASPTSLTFSAELYSEPFASLGCAMIIYFLIRYRILKRMGDLIALFIGMIIFFFTRSIYTLLIIPIILPIFYKINKYQVLIVVFGTAFVFLKLAFSLSGGRSDYNLAIQSSKVFQSYSTIGACAVYYLSYPLGKNTLPQYEGACRQNNPTVGMPGYQENPYVIAETLRENFGISRWLQIVFFSLPKYILIMLTSMITLVFVEGVYIPVATNSNSLLVVAIVGIIKLFFAFYIWSRLIRHFYLFTKKHFWYGLVSIVPLIYFFIVVGNFPVEQRYFYPLLPWLYFYAALNKSGISKLIRV
jgi:hypothetical protein